MMHKLLPDHIDPFRYAEQKLMLVGKTDLKEMQRLGDFLHSKAGEVIVSLDFGVDEQGVSFLKGHLETTLLLTCQRCLEPFDYKISSHFVLGIVHTIEEANTLPDSYEPALVIAGELAVREIIEDELILNLPIIPKHELDLCKVHLPLTNSGREQEKKDNPFHVLKSLKQKQ